MHGSNSNQTKEAGSSTVRCHSCSSYQPHLKFSHTCVLPVAATATHHGRTCPRDLSQFDPIKERKPSCTFLMCNTYLYTPAKIEVVYLYHTCTEKLYGPRSGRVAGHMDRSACLATDRTHVPPPAARCPVAARTARSDNLSSWVPHSRSGARL